jgi:hypothetical protein
MCLVLTSGSYVACMQGLSKKGQIHKRAATRLLELCKDQHPLQQLEYLFCVSPISTEPVVT